MCIILAICSKYWYLRIGSHLTPFVSLNNIHLKDTLKYEVTLGCKCSDKEVTLTRLSGLFRKDSTPTIKCEFLYFNLQFNNLIFCVTTFSILIEIHKRVL